ncbi:MAG: LLM class flavin-dependent oxidoreductase [Acidimicrobiales bacterium]|nr:LLM class flavin-dependent oxidoreductase [Acidimicrobiales bacterium]
MLHDLTSGPVFEAEITPGMSPLDAVDLGVQVEAAGFHRIGVSCVALWPDTYQIQTLIADRTETIQIGSMVTNPYTRHVAVHASAVATLQEVSEGRAFLGIGVGAGLEELGFSYNKPVQTLRETITAFRQLLSGESTTVQGEYVSIQNSRLLRELNKPVPVAIGTRSPGVMRLAGELADVALIGARHLTHELLEEYRDWLALGASRTGRNLRNLEILPRVTLCISSDADLAIHSVKRYAAHYLSILGEQGPKIDSSLRDAIETALAQATGWYFDTDRYDPPELMRLIDNELAQQFAIAGTPEQCAEQLKTLLALGVDGASFNLAAVARGSMFEGLSETIEGAKKMLDLIAET